MTEENAGAAAIAGTNLPEYGVSELAGALRRTIEGAFALVRVRGEIGKVTQPRSGHLYLTLKDAEACLESVVWKGTLGRLGLVPEQGMEVVCTGRLTTYGARSQYQLVIERMELAGEGALLKLLEERRRRLAAEGLFEAAAKRALPFLPDVIGVVTSPTGAVIRDILHRLADRFPRRVIVWPVAVQGEGAARQVADAIAGFDAIPVGGPIPRPDLLIVARGGGSLEDLMPFNEEIVVRAAALCTIPLIAAVGHETDTTLIDLAADRRAPTPTAAAEMAVPVRAELLADTIDYRRRLVAALGRLVGERRTRLDGLGRGLGDPSRLIEAAVQRLDDRALRLDRGLVGLVERGRARAGEAAARLPHPRRLVAEAGRHLGQIDQRLGVSGRAALRQAAERLAAITGRVRPAPLLRLAGERADRLGAAARLLESFSYRDVLRRGYALVLDARGEIVAAAAGATPGKPVTLRFHDGDASAVIAMPRRAPPPKPAVGQGSLL
jgi:exodeoxyribonuclease VII large subunit